MSKCVNSAPKVEKMEQNQDKKISEKGRTENMVMVGRKAPDFEANAYHKGKFTKVKLSDHLGKWVVLCFYPGDFTFV